MMLEVLKVLTFYDLGQVKPRSGQRRVHRIWMEIWLLMLE